MWAPLAADLVRDHTVVVPDLRGLGLSSKPAGGFDKRPKPAIWQACLTRRKIERTDLVTHDIGNMVGYRVCRSASRPGHALRPDRCADARCRPVGGDPQESAAMAFPVRWP